MGRHSEANSPVNSSPPLSPGMSSTSATEFVDQSDFEYHVLKEIRSASESQVLVFTDINPSWGEQIVDLINETDDGYSTRKTYDSLTKVLRIKVMPTELHDCCQSWWRLSEINLRRIGDLTDDEQAQLDVLVGATLPFVGGPYRSSRKEPDLFVRSIYDRLPSFVIETGWSESWGALMDDMNLLLVGGNGDIRAVAIIKWKLNRRTRVVSGFVELYDIFPAPTETTTPQRLDLSRQKAFGPSLLPDPARAQPPNDMVYLEVEDLRTVARRALDRMSLFPAV
ncbi:Pc12g02850 [Penicillium rubens Wisconsin 54-1255]|uniref:Pc12g02850 protein n=1 Tax=Penicillium rubens (strain ATCC 28089 / DSM 1075 / NRRL 1951 / Wisconsin 54-1255) TaxID=500485 RepID=B6H0C6_PENRW|nr:Pc12g02850 [Penicillium rubens Wisconsin 54-1255]